ncbi:MAG: glycosyltransferase [Ferruginibacter sp.]
MGKKTILHCIYSLGRGGAETMLLATLKELTEYNHVVVTLADDNHFAHLPGNCRHISLGMKNTKQLPLLRNNFRKLIRMEKPVLVHSHLYWPTILCRVSVRKEIPLVTTIHTSVGSAGDYKKKYIRLLDKYSFRKRPSYIIAVSEGVLKDYISLIPASSQQAEVIYTFVDEEKIQHKINLDTEGRFRFVCTGALRVQKNMERLIQLWPDEHNGFDLDIYGDGPLKTSLEKMAAGQTAVKLKGEVDNIEEVLPQYDGYISGSAVEGFSLSILEAMGTGIPLLLNDIASFREQCGETATYFHIQVSKEGFLETLQKFQSQSALRAEMAMKALELFQQNYSRIKHINALRNIYNNQINAH